MAGNNVLSWGEFRDFIDAKKMNFQVLDLGTSYYLITGFGRLTIECNLPKDLGADQTEYEATYAAKANLDIVNPVLTQFERKDLTLKCARLKVEVTSNVGRAEIKIPGNFPDTGRYIEGGYALMDSYDADDYLLSWVEDKDRKIAMLMALAMDPSATEPLTDEQVRGSGQAPASYPILDTYYDTDVDPTQAGWYFWPTAQGNSLPPIGECEIEPMGWYGQLPSEMYLVLEVHRPNVATGVLRGDLFWGKKE